MAPFVKKILIGIAALLEIELRQKIRDAREPKNSDSMPLRGKDIIKINSDIQSATSKGLK